MTAQETVERLRRIAADVEGAEKGEDGHRVTTLSDYDVDALEGAAKLIEDLTTVLLRGAQ